LAQVEPDFFTIAVSIATIRRRIARPACDDGLARGTNAPDAPVQRVDYVYVRRAAASEPTSSVLGASSLACGSTP
jgi:hypothetical protein